MKIVLIRHGKPDYDTRCWIGAHDVRRSLQQYRDTRVTTRPADEIQILENEVKPHVMTSGLARAQDSATLFLDCQFEVSELLNEADIPYPERLIVPLPWSVLLFVYRLGWLLGYRSNAPGLRRDLNRANQAAELLIDRATKHVNVYVFGHGIMNRLIVRELKKKDGVFNLKLAADTGAERWCPLQLLDAIDIMNSNRPIVR